MTNVKLFFFEQDKCQTCQNTHLALLYYDMISQMTNEEWLMTLVLKFETTWEITCLILLSLHAQINFVDFSFKMQLTQIFKAQRSLNVFHLEVIFHVIARPCICWVIFFVCWKYGFDLVNILWNFGKWIFN